MLKLRLLFIALFIGMTAAHAEETPIQSLLVDEVELLGITVFTQTDLEKVLEVGPGERIDRRKVIQTGRNLQDLYRLHGYEQMRLQTELIQRQNPTTKARENVLSIQISEGMPTRIADVRLVFDDPKWQERLEPLVNRLGVATGEVYDQEKLANGYRVLQESISSSDFIGVKVNEAEVIPTTPQGLAQSPALLSSTAKWVKLIVKVELGERVSFGFRGNQVYTNPQLQALVDEQRLLGLSRDYLSRLQSRIEDEYRKTGYDRVKVEVFTFENAAEQRRHVTFSITEGPRIEIENVSFDGNTVYDASTLREKFYEFATPALARRYYVAKDVEKTAGLLVEWVKSQGYLGAKVVNISRSYTLDGKKVNIVAYVYEGEQTIVDRITFRGLSVLTPGEVKQILGVKEEQPLNLYAFSEGIEILKSSFRARGYLDMRITNERADSVVTYTQENRIADILLELEEGVQYRITKIVVNGLRKTKQKVVDRELEMRVGDIAEEPKIFQSEANLRRLGVFGSSTIKLEQDPEKNDGKILIVNVEEGTPGLIAGGVGLRNDLGGRAFGQISYSNLWGRNHTISLSAAANRRFKRFGANFCPNDVQREESPNTDHCFVEYDVSLDYAWPWIFIGQTTFRPGASVDRNQYKDFDASNRALTFSLERQLWKSLNLTGILTYSLEFIEQFNANRENAAEDNRNLRIGSFTPALIMDKRDSPLTPTRGTYTTISLELARPEFLSQRNPVPVSYSRFQFRNDAFIPLPRGIGFFASFRTGVAYNLSQPPADDPNNTSYQIPLIKRFTLGGVGSLRGFSEQSLSTSDKISIRGYQSYVNYRAQLDFPFAGALHIGPFIDAANLNVDTYRLDALRFGVGGGLRYRSPVGPVNFDVGVNPRPRPGEDSYQVHFSIGTI